MNIYHQAKDETGYVATRFIQMVGKRGGVVTAKKLIDADHESECYAACLSGGRLDLTVEAVAVDNPVPSAVPPQRGLQGKNSPHQVRLRLRTATETGTGHQVKREVRLLLDKAVDSLVESITPRFDQPI